MLRDIRGKNISEGDVLVFLTQPQMVDAIVQEITPPMVQQTPQGQVMLQKMRVLIQYDFMVAANTGAPVAIIEKADSEVAQKAQESLKKLVEKMTVGAGGGSLVVSG